MSENQKPNVELKALLEAVDISAQTLAYARMASTDAVNRHNEADRKFREARDDLTQYLSKPEAP